MADATCAITRTAVGIGNDILIVGVKQTGKSTSFNTHDLANDVAFHLEIKDIQETQEDKDRYESKNSPFRFAKIGVYDDYGSIDGLGIEQGLIHPFNSWDWKFIIHKEVAESLINEKLLDGNVPFESVAKIISLANKARIELCTGLVGHSYCYEDELDLQTKICQLTEQKIAQIRRQSRC
jgi:hypothetical protein